MISGRAGAGSVFVADSGNGLVGFSICGPERSGHTVYRGELYAIYVLEQYQGKGLGRQLFDAVRSRLVRDGFDSMLLWVLDRNPACAFYERMGGSRVGADRKSVV
jgi:GNAT superfamily N-acetyltransferase